MKTITVFNHKGGVGKTSVVFSLGLALGRAGKKVLLVDLDPQANLSALALDDDTFEDLYDDGEWTVATALQPLVSGSGDIQLGDVYRVRKNVFLVPGDIRLAEFESILPQSITEALAGQERGFRITSAVFRLIQLLGNTHGVDYVLCDVGPNIGALNQVILTASDYFLVPVSCDLFSLRALDTVGKSVAKWVDAWAAATSRAGKGFGFALPAGTPQFLGYVQQHFGIYREKATKAFGHWQERIPPAMDAGVIKPLREIALAGPGAPEAFHLADIRDYHSLAPRAQQSHKAVFELDSAEAVGQHQETVSDAWATYFHLAERIVADTK